MKVLFVSPYVPSKRAGHGTAAFMGGLLGQLVGRHEITLATFFDESEAPFLSELSTAGITVEGIRRARGHQPGLAANAALLCGRVVSMARSVSTWTPYYAMKWRDRRMLRLVEHLTSANRFDIVQFELAFMAEYAEAVCHGKTVLHEHDLAYRPAYRRAHRPGGGAARVVGLADWCMWARYELSAVRKADAVLTVTEQDCRLLTRLAGTHNVSYLPRAVDPAAIPDDGARDAATIVFVGSFAHQPNVEAALSLIRDVAPKVLAKFPTVRFVVAGKQPPAVVVSAALKIPAVTLAGFVPDVNDVLRRATVFVAPLRFGGGIKIKILHAMAQAVPVVTTPVGAEGIEGMSAGTNILVGRTTDSLARHVCELLADPVRARAIGRAGHAAVTSLYSWKRVVGRLEEIYSATLLKDH